MELLIALPSRGELTVILISAIAGLLAASAMALVKAYSNPVFAFLARLPIVGPSPEEYSLPTSSEREQLAQYIDLEGLDVRIDRTEQAIPCGEVDGFRVGPIGVTGITITANAFEDPRYLSAIATHELGHLERKDTLLIATVVT